MRGQLAACKLDQLWDGWAKTLTASYATTVRCLAEGKTVDAHKEYKGTFHPAVKRVYSEAAVTCPERYAGYQDWAAWLRHLYALSVKTDKALRKAASAVESRDAQLEARKTAVRNLRSSISVTNIRPTCNFDNRNTISLECFC
jgi:hypothetical protein